MFRKMKNWKIRSSGSYSDNLTIIKSNEEKLTKVNGIFGISMIDSNHENLSEFLFNCIEYIKKQCSKPTSNGIFRRCCDFERKIELQKCLNDGIFFSYNLIEEINDQYTISSLLKSYLRELPDCIFKDLYEKFILEEKNILQEKENIKVSLSKSLSPYEKVFVHALFNLFKFLSDNFEFTNLKSKSLSILFTPMLYTKDLIGFYRKEKEQFNNALGLTEFLISSFDEILEDLIEENDKINYKGTFLRYLEKSAFGNAVILSH